MAMTDYGKGKKKARRIGNLRVEKVSFVDRAANGTEFLLYKRDSGTSGRQVFNPRSGAASASSSQREEEARNRSYDHAGVMATIRESLAKLTKRA